MAAATAIFRELFPRVGPRSATLSMFRVSVSLVGVTCDSEAVHALEVHVELASRMLSLRPRCNHNIVCKRKRRNCPMCLEIPL